jgi:hypothetical protein
MAEQTWLQRLIARFVGSTARPRPWYLHDRYDEAIIGSTARAIAQTREYFDARIRRQYKYEYLYQREDWRASDGVGWRAPLWLQDSGLGLDDDFGSLENVIKGRIDFLVSLLFTEQPAIEVKASGVSFEVQQAVLARGRALNALFNTPEAEHAFRLAGRQGLIGAWAGIWPRIVGDAVIFAPVALEQCWWDPFDARDGRPKTFGVMEYMDRSELLAWYEALDCDVTYKRDRMRKVAEMPAASRFDYGLQSLYDWELEAYNVTDCTDRLLVSRFWRTATTVAAADGREVVVVSSGPGDVKGAVLLLDEPFARTTIPVVGWSPYPAMRGLIGTGYASLLEEPQKAVDYHWHRVLKQSRECGWNKIITDERDALPEDVLAAYAAEDIVPIPGRGVAPQVLQTPAIRREDLDLINIIKNASAETYGMNQMLAGGNTGLSGDPAGVAMAEEADRQIDRQSDIYESFSMLRIGAAREFLNAVDEAVKRNSDFRTVYHAYGRSRDYSWAKLSLPHDRYSVSLEQAGELARTRAGRYAKIQALAEMQLVSPADAQYTLLTTPDLQSLGENTTAPRDLIEDDLDQLCREDGDHEVMPSEDHDLPLAIQRSGQKINMAKLHRASFETIERLREYRRAAQALLQKATATAPGTAGVSAVPVGVDPLIPVSSAGIPGAPAQEMPLAAPIQ